MRDRGRKGEGAHLTKMKSRPVTLEEKQLPPLNAVQRCHEKVDGRGALNRRSVGGLGRGGGSPASICFFLMVFRRKSRLTLSGTFMCCCCSAPP